MTDVLSYNCQSVALFAALNDSEQQILPSMFASIKVVHQGNSRRSCCLTFAQAVSVVHSLYACKH